MVRACLRVFSGDRAARKLSRSTFHQCRRRLQAYILNGRLPESGITAQLRVLTSCYSFATPWTSRLLPRTGTCWCNTRLLSQFIPATFFPDPYFPLVRPHFSCHFLSLVSVIVHSKFGAPVLQNTAHPRLSNMPALTAVISRRIHSNIKLCL